VGVGVWVWVTVRLRTWPVDVCVSVMPPICDAFGVHYMLFSPSTAGKACRDASACAAICDDDLRGLRRHRK
jgi:hypothetical protein